MKLEFFMYDWLHEKVYFNTEHGNMLAFDRYDIQEAWIKYGGSFLSTLWEALAHADMVNAWKIITAFNNYIADYFNQDLLTCKLIENYE